MVGYNCRPLFANEVLQVTDYQCDIQHLTSKQAVIYALLREETHAAEKLKPKYDTSACGNGRGPEIEKLLRQYENIINQLT
jgi:hypothetical protein